MAGRHFECLRCRSDNNWPASVKLWLLTFVRRFLCVRAAANIMPTEWLGGLIHLPNATTAPHGLDTSTPPIDVASSRPPLIIFQGRLVTTKGLPVLFEAASILQSGHREFEVLVIGDGPERPGLQDLAEKLQLSSCVRFVGRLAAAELDSAFRKASVVVMPSLGGEVFGLVLAENMLRSLPIVASDLGCFVEVLGDAGLTFRTGDANDFASQIARLLDDSVLASRLGGRARQRICECFTRRSMIETHARLCRNMYSAAHS
jgi:glycosyltransferase involved in cell wall biosynthesis